VIPTIVIAKASKPCSDEPRCYRGIVLYDANPVAWWCLTEQEIPAFKAWATGAFSSLHIVTAEAPDDSINCSPPTPPGRQAPTASPAELPMTPKLEMRAALQARAQVWLAMLRPTTSTTQDLGPGFAMSSTRRRYRRSSAQRRARRMMTG